MNIVRTKLGDGGRVIIPATFCKKLHLIAGDDIVLHIEKDIICITTPNQALQKLQTKVKNHINTLDQDISLVDELIAIRRLEIDRE